MISVKEIEQAAIEERIRAMVLGRKPHLISITWDEAIAIQRYYGFPPFEGDEYKQEITISGVTHVALKPGHEVDIRAG